RRGRADHARRNRRRPCAPRLRCVPRARTIAADSGAGGAPMKSFSNPAYMLANARLEVRLAYTGFLALAAIGMVTMGIVQWGHMGPLPSDIVTYVRGGERAGAMVFPKAFRELVELTHAHAFVMGVVYLILGHLIIATTAPPRVKVWSVALGFAGLTGDVLG